MKALLITSLDDAEYYINHSNLYKDYITCTNLTSVHAIIEKKLNTKCIDLNIFLSEKIIKKNFEELVIKYLKFLEKLDKNYSTKINTKLKLKKINWFFALYRYQVLYSFLGINQLFIVLIKFIKQLKIKEIFIFNKFYVKDNIIKNKEYVFLLGQFCEKNKIKLKYIKIDTLKKKTKKIAYNFFLNFVKTLKTKLRLTINKINFLIKVKNNDINSIAFGPMWELNYYKNKIGNFLIYDIENIASSENIKKNYKIKSQIKFEDPILNKFHEILLDHLNKNLTYYEISLKKIKNIIHKFNIDQFYWGLPPTESNAKSIIINYLVNNNYNVIGMQHGGGYGTTNDDSFHVLSDYMFCNTFLSYGKIYLKLVKKFKNLNYKTCNFNVIGSPRINLYVKKKIYLKKLLHKNKILFPINLCHHILKPKLNINSNLMFNIQKDVLSYLNKFNKKSSIKLFQNDNRDFIQDIYPCKIIIDDYKNLRIHHKSNFLYAMKDLNPSLVILDQFSTPVYEIINSNCEIICFLNSLCDIKKIYHASLKRRIHFVRNIQEFKKIMNAYNSGVLKLKYNSSYTDKRLLKSNI